MESGQRYVMIICETLLISIIGILGFYVTITDIKHGIIQNKRLLQAGTIGFFINVVYYSRFAYGFFQLYISNLREYPKVCVNLQTDVR